MTARLAPRLALLACLACGSALAPVHAQGANDRSPLAACTIDNVPARCGVYHVWENRTTRTGHRIPLRVVVLPASSAERLPDPVVPLVGGPGEGAATSADDFIGFGRGARDVVLVDSRGTGDSGPLACGIAEPRRNPPLLDSLFPGWLVGPCRSRLETIADLRQYTTRNKAADLAEVLDGLGYGRVNLWGGSYGTRTAMEFMRLYPARVRTAYLTAPVAPDVRTLPLEMARSAQNALNQVFAMCDTAPECRRAFPELREEFASLLELVSRGPVPVTVGTAAAPRPALLGRTGFGYAVRGALYGGLAEWLPLMIHRAAQSRDLSWFAKYWLIRGTWAWSEFPAGLYLSVVCTEDMGPVSNDSVRRATRGTFLGEGLYRQYERACAQWPKGELPPNLHELVRSPIPAVVVSGTRDPVTPAANADRVAAALSRSARVVFRNSGHGGARGCEPLLARALVERGSADGLDSLPCARRPAPFSFALGGEPPASLMR